LKNKFPKPNIWRKMGTKEWESGWGAKRKPKPSGRRKTRHPQTDLASQQSTKFYQGAGKRQRRK
jgi:hypothetical protein